MRDNIYTIPVSEVFEPKCGCPICRMRDMLEKRCIEYIMGAAMMEPDIRIETNKAGFCTDHFQMMLGQKNRLSLALMLESHLDEMEKQVFSGVPLLGKSAGRQGKDAGRAAESCFVCRQVDWAMERMLASVCRLWEQEMGPMGGDEVNLIVAEALYHHWPKADEGTLTRARAGVADTAAPRTAARERTRRSAPIAGRPVRIVRGC